MPRFPVAQNNPYKVSGPEIYYETEIWYCCKPWEVVTATYTWSNEIDAFKRESWWVRNCGICGEPPRPRLEDRI